MADELLRILALDPLVFAVQVYMLGFVMCAAFVLLAELLRRRVWTAVRRRGNESPVRGWRVQRP